MRPPFFLADFLSLPFCSFHLPSKMTTRELRAELSYRQDATYGSKKELVKRLQVGWVELGRGWDGLGWGWGCGWWGSCRCVNVWVGGGVTWGRGGQLHVQDVWGDPWVFGVLLASWGPGPRSGALGLWAPCLPATSHMQ